MILLLSCYKFLLDKKIFLNLTSKINQYGPKGVIENRVWWRNWIRRYKTKWGRGSGDPGWISIDPAPYNNKGDLLKDPKPKRCKRLKSIPLLWKKHDSSETILSFRSFLPSWPIPLQCKTHTNRIRTPWPNHTLVRQYLVLVQKNLAISIRKSFHSLEKLDPSVLTQVEQIIKRMK